MTDTYSVVEASRVLGVSEKRVRQFVDAGRLVAVESRPLRVGQEAVVRLREERKTEPAGPARGSGGGADVLGRLETLVDRITEGNRRALETAEASARSTEAALRDMLAQSQARVTELEARLAERDAELAEAKIRRGIFRRNP